MDKKAANERVEKLRKEIDDLRYRYHVLDDPTVTDTIYDSLTRELKKLEEKWPEFLTPDSPTQRVGGKALEKFAKVTHHYPMLSLTDAFDENEFRAWDERAQKLLSGEVEVEYFCELKVDGFAVALVYDRGIFSVGATRGDGRVGEDVTQNLKTIRAIPLRLREDAKEVDKIAGEGAMAKILRGRFEVRGEVYMTKKSFARVNRAQEKSGGATYANPRNLAAGSIRQLDPAIAASRDLDFMAYDIVTDIGQRRHSDEHKILSAVGFKTVAPDRLCSTINQVIKFRERVAKIRERLAFDIDGIVVSTDDNSIFQRLGAVGKAPRGAVAFKFPAKESTTVVEDIIVQVGRTGVLTPVAVLRPVEISGVTVSRATLHNLDEIRRLDVRVGDTVVVERAGDVIPAVSGVLKHLRPKGTKEFQMPKHCPICGAAVIRGEGKAAYRCSNKNCSAIQRAKLYHFVSKRALDIEGLGRKNIDALADNGLIRDPADLFLLKKEDIEQLERFGEKSAANLIAAIAAKRRLPLNRFLYALGIQHVGEETALDLAARFGALGTVKDASLEELTEVRDIGQAVAGSVYEWFRNERNIKLLKKFEEAGLKVENQKTHRAGGKFSDKIFVLTGSMSGMTRDEAKEKIRSLGGAVSEGVSRETNFVVAGAEPGSKYAKAKRLGVKIIGEKEFLRML